MDVTILREKQEKNEGITWIIEKKKEKKQIKGRK